MYKCKHFYNDSLLISRDGELVSMRVYKNSAVVQFVCTISKEILSCRHQVKLAYGKLAQEHIHCIKEKKATVEGKFGYCINLRYVFNLMS